MAPSPDEAERLNVVALISGGKDSFFSLLHCLANGHRVVALANLYPPASSSSVATITLKGQGQGQNQGQNQGQGQGKGKCEDGGVTAIMPGQGRTDDLPAGDEDGAKEDEEGEVEGEVEGEEEDLNSFMYQTVGHKVIPLYAEATGLPLYRRAITGGAGGSGKDYKPGEDGDETESMTHLLQAVMEAHPEVNAVCSGAVLSNYQRTRVESVAVRLGLVPLAYLWQFPVLPAGGETFIPGGDERVTPAAGVRGGADDDARLLDDMADAGLDARIIKVASGGLDETFLGLNVASEEGADRLRKAMRRFGGAEKGSGATIGEGGEFETLVVDGPPQLFKKRIVIEKEGGSRIVREGGGTAWLDVRKARLDEKRGAGDDSHESDGTVVRPSVRIPNYGLEDRAFPSASDEPYTVGTVDDWPSGLEEEPIAPEGRYMSKGASRLKQWCVVGDAASSPDIASETTSLMSRVRALLDEASLPPSSILNTVIVLRNMSDFPVINKIYGSLFTEPNPPSRVCISCGDALPQNRNIAVYLSVHHALASSDRQGLHVQSRSYWAPANIGPYSQAISVPIASLSSARDITQEDSTGTRMVQIAGQIELDPGKMTMHRDKKSGFFSPMPLALLHLWRIGQATDVQWWSSVVAYLPDDGYTAGDEARAAETWRRMHTDKPTDDDGATDGPDAWDRKHNPQYMTYSSQEAGPKALPDTGVLCDFDPEYDDGPMPLPAFVAARVMTLPREASVEWHAHLGFSHVQPDAIRIYDGQSESMRVHHTVVDLDDRGVFVHTVLTVTRAAGEDPEKMPLAAGVLAEMNLLYLARIAALAGMDVAQSLGEVAPTHVYANIKDVDVAAEDVGRAGCPVIPCYNLWAAKSKTKQIVEEVTAVGVYQTFLEKRSG